MHLNLFIVLAPNYFRSRVQMKQTNRQPVLYINTYLYKYEFMCIYIYIFESNKFCSDPKSDLTNDVNLIRLSVSLTGAWEAAALL